MPIGCPVGCPRVPFRMPRKLLKLFQNDQKEGLEKNALVTTKEQTEKECANHTGNSGFG